MSNVNKTFLDECTVIINILFLELLIYNCNQHAANPILSGLLDVARRTYTEIVDDALGIIFIVSCVLALHRRSNS